VRRDNALRSKKVLIVTDGKVGHENQSKAFCSGIGKKYDILNVSYRSPLAKAAAYLLDRLGILSTLPFKYDYIPKGKNYSAVVCTGSTAFYPGKVFARKNGLPVCAILTPSGFKMDFDCILAPQFDNPPKLPNVISLPVNLTSNTTEFYTDAVKAFEQRHRARKPAIGIVIGGPNSFSSMKPDEMRKRLDLIFELTGAYERWVTTSRRTPPEIEKIIDSYPFDYKLIYSRDKFNPIPAFVSLCDRIFVTADSTGMLSEAVTYGKAKVEVINNIKGTGSKFYQFVKDLEQIKAVHIFDNSLGFASNKVDLQPVLNDAVKLMFRRETEKREEERGRRKRRDSSGEKRNYREPKKWQAMQAPTVSRTARPKHRQARSGRGRGK
jgi:mitochondrial fission protein ELM1